MQVVQAHRDSTSCCQSAWKNISKAAKCSHMQCWPTYVYATAFLGSMVGAYILKSRNITAGFIAGGFLGTIAGSLILNRPPPEIDPDAAAEELEAINALDEQNQRDIEAATAREGEEKKQAEELTMSVRGTVENTRAAVAEAKKSHQNAGQILDKMQITAGILRDIKDDSSDDGSHKSDNPVIADKKLSTSAIRTSSIETSQKLKESESSDQYNWGNEEDIV